MTKSSVMAQSGVGRQIVGIILLVLGILVWFWPFTPNASLQALVALGGGLLLVAWAVVNRQPSYLPLSALLLALGASVFLLRGPYELSSDDVRSGVFALSLAGAFILTSLLGPVLGGRVIWWSLLLGVVLAALGGALAMGAISIGKLDRFATFVRFWPALLVVVGLTLLLRRNP